MKKILFLILFFITLTPLSLLANSFIYCDNCSDDKAKFKAIVSGKEGIVDVGDIESGILRSYNVTEITRFGEMILTATAVTSDSIIRDKFITVHSSYKSVISGVYATDIVNTPWEAIQSPYLGNRVISQVIEIYGATLTQAAINYFNAAASLSNVIKPMNIRIKTPDGGFLLYKIEENVCCKVYH